MHPTSEDRFKEIAIPHFRSGQLVLEVGPDNIPSTYLRHLQQAGVEVSWHYVETEIGRDPSAHDGRRVSLLSDYQIDSADETWDVIFHGQVLEHVRKPWRFLCETSRILKTGGKMIMIHPAQWSHHEPAPDCWRIYPEGVRALLDEAGISCEFCDFFVYPDGTADTVSVGVKRGSPLIGSFL